MKSLAVLSRSVLVALCFGLAAAEAKPIKLRNQTIDPAKGALAAANAGQHRGLFLVQFNGPVRPEWREELRRLGVETLQYVPEDAFVIRIRGGAHAAIARLAFVEWLGPYRSDHKVDGGVTRAAQGGAVSVLLARGTGANDLAQLKRSFRSVKQESHGRFGSILRGELAAGELNRLAESDAVLWIEPEPKMKLFDEVASEIVAGPGGVNTTTIQDLGYDGSGVVVSVADSGLHSGNAAGMHPDLAGRVVAFFQYGELEDASDEHSHGTHVAGIIAGNGATGETDEFGFLYGLGVAPGASIIAQRMFDGLGNYEPPGSFAELTRDAVSAGADIGSNSWGEDNQGRYDISAAEFDALVRDADDATPGDQPYILEFSAGNAGGGYQTIGTPAVAKNVIATGAAQNNRPDFFVYAEGPDAMADFSSRGPCEDGRIKPDIVAPGTWIASLRSVLADDNNAWAPISFNYLYQGGTSQSGPHVSGGAAVFVQYYRENFGGATPSPALVKAALINSAVDMDDSVQTAPAPNNDEGWGRMDLTELIDSVRAYEFVDQTALLATGQFYERRFMLANPQEPLKVTLTYTDVPGFPGAIPALVNDLDLEVVGPDGAVYRGNQFHDGESLPNAAASDAINNVEGVHLFEPVPGEYVVRVRARNVADDARGDTVAADQDFALVISADILPPGVGAIFMNRSAYTAPDLIRITVLDTDLAGQATTTINVRSTAEAAGETIVLRAATASGVFTNSIATATGAAMSDGRLQIAHGNVITAQYQDTPAGGTRTDTAIADLVRPVITGVSVTNRFGRPVITWTTDELANGRVLYGTNSALGLVATNAEFELTQEISLTGLIAGRTYFFKVASTDVAGNAVTNDNGGALYSFVAPSVATVLVVDAFFDDLFFDPPPPIENYTLALDAIGVDYDLWEVALEGSPSLEDIRPYRTVIWRLPEIGTTQPTFTPEEQSAIVNYLAGGGSLFVASMEVLTRLGEAGATAFRANVFQVTSFVEDTGMPAVDGVAADPITDGLSLSLDYSNYDTILGPFDISDVITPSSNAAGIFLSPDGAHAGLRHPRAGFESPGRVVFFSFPFDTIPMSGPAPNNRPEVMRRVLNFLAPGLGGVGVLTLDKGSYLVPSAVKVQLADSDLAGAGQATITAANARSGQSMSVLLMETSLAGTFAGSFNIGNVAGPETLAGQDGDQISVTYFDASRARTVTAAAVVDTRAPAISDVAQEVDYVDAFISWNTSERTDALVQFGESAFLGRTAYDARLDFSHEVHLVGLAPDQTYYYRVVSRDEAGNTIIDDNGGDLYTFRTLRPIIPPWVDNLDTGATNWTVFDFEDSLTTWRLGIPNNGWESQANSPPNAWGSHLDGGVLDQADTVLVSPAIHLAGGNRATLRFWQSYDFTEKTELDIFEIGGLLIVTNVLYPAVPLASYQLDATGWEEVEIDLTPYVGNVVYLAWQYAMQSFDFAPRTGWLIDDVSVTMSTVTPGVVVITNNIFQARFNISGQLSRSGAGVSHVVTNASPGSYTVTYQSVPSYTTPAPQTQTLPAGGTITFAGQYTFADANTNGISDAWETEHFGSVSSSRTASTDTDGDGMTDLQEFRAGTNPTAAGSQFEIAAPLLLPDGRLRLQWATGRGRGYRLEGSTNGYSWMPVTSWLVAPGTLLTHEVPAWSPGAPFLFRVAVQP